MISFVWSGLVAVLFELAPGDCSIYSVSTSKESIGDGGILPVLSELNLDCSTPSYDILNGIQFQTSLSGGSSLGSYSYYCLDSSQFTFKTITSKSTSSICHGGDLSGGLIQLMDHDIDCGGIGLLMSLKLNYVDACCPNYCQYYSYRCGNFGTLTCRDVVNPATDIGSTSTQNVLFLNLQDIACNATEGIGHIHYELVAGNVDGLSLLRPKWRADSIDGSRHRLWSQRYAISTTVCRN